MYVGDDRYNLLPEENITTNLHHDGVTPDSFAMNQRLSSLFSVLSTKPRQLLVRKHDRPDSLFDSPPIVLASAAHFAGVSGLNSRNI